MLLLGKSNLHVIYVHLNLFVVSFKKMCCVLLQYTSPFMRIMHWTMCHNTLYHLVIFPPLIVIWSIQTLVDLKNIRVFGDFYDPLQVMYKTNINTLTSIRSNCVQSNLPSYVKTCILFIST